MFRPRLWRLLPAAALACLLAPVPGAWAKAYPPGVGEAHPQIVLPTIDGEQVIALSSLRGKKVLLVHFASW